MTRPSRSPSAPAPRIRMRLLGPVAVEVDGAPLEVDTRKAVALLAHLAVTRRTVSRETVAAFLWPEADGPDGRGALRRTLSVLRSGLGEPGLLVDRSTIALDVTALDVDLWRFEAALAVARGHAHPGDGLCPACLDALERAAALDGGEFMAGFSLRDAEEFDEWQLAEAASHRRELAGVLERLARGRAAAHAWAPAAATARRWLELDPLHEPAHRLLMEVLARSGEPAAALAQYRACVRTLDHELGVAPLSETTDLAEAIRAGRLVPRPTPDEVALAAPMEPTPVHAPPSFATPQTPPATSSGPLLVGRDVELRTLTGSRDGVGGPGRLLLIEGEPGIGKTRLAAEVVALTRDRGGTILEARAYAGEAAIPLSVVAELLRSGLSRPDAVDRIATVDPVLVAEVARLLPIHGIPAAVSPSGGDPFGRVRLFDGLAAVLAALVREPGPGLVWVDDLQLADASTLEFLAYLARRLPELGFTLLTAWRVEDLEPGVRERILDPAASPGLVTVVPLRRFDRSDVAALARVVLGAPPTAGRVEALFEESEGLPLYVVEALASSDAERAATPGGVQALLRARIAAVSEIGRQILGAAAVIGRSFDPGLVRAASGRGEEETVVALEELVRRGLVREVVTDARDDLRLDFTHARLRDVAYDGLSLARRRLLHGRVATALRASSAAAREGGVRWSLIAYHETLAGWTEAAADAHRQAGDEARAVFANEEAREHLETALALGHPAVAELHGALGEVLTLLGDYEGALFHLASAAALAGPEDQGRLEYGQGLVHARRGDWDRAEGHLVAALAATDDPATRSRILADRSAIADRSGDALTADRLAGEALALAESVDDPVGIARALDLLGILARRRGELPIARAYLERALGVLDAAGAQRDGSAPPPTAPLPPDRHDPGVRIAALNTLALVLAGEGDRSRAIELTREALERCERQGDRHRQAALENNLADLLQASDRPDEAMEHLKRAVALFAEIGGRPGELEPEIWKLVEW